MPNAKPAHRPLLEPRRGRRRNRKITITDDRWEQAKELGKGSASEGIAVALDWRKTEESKDGD